MNELESMGESYAAMVEDAMVFRHRFAALTQGETICPGAHERLAHLYKSMAASRQGYFERLWNLSPMNCWRRWIRHLHERPMISFLPSPKMAGNWIHILKQLGILKGSRKAEEWISQINKDTDDLVKDYPKTFEEWLDMPAREEWFWRPFYEENAGLFYWQSLI